MYNLASISLEIAQSPPLQGAEGPIGEIGWLWVLVFLLVVIVVWSRLVQPVETPDIHTEHGHEHGDGEAEAAHAEMEAAHAEPESEPEEPHPVPAATTAAAVAVPEEVESEAPSEPDNLAKLEGIGPKINKLLQDAGITTFAELAETATERLDEIVDAAGLTFADVSTWPEQARLAAAEDWEALEKLQEELKGGRRS